jgi:hypothetical protein
MPYPTSTVAASIPPGNAHTLAEWWVALRKGRPYPERTDFHPEDIARWWPDIILYDVERRDGLLAYRFRVHGENAAASDGGNFTGKLLNDVLVPAMRDSILRDYGIVVASGKAIYSKLTREAVQGFPVEFERLLLPFGTGQVTTILCYLKRGPVDHTRKDGIGLQDSQKPFVTGFITQIDE